jgi:hypothetical protein
MLKRIHRQQVWYTAVGAIAMVSAAAATLIVPSSAEAATSSTTLVVNAGTTLRSVTHVATGSLYGLATASTPADNLVQAIKPNTFVQMAIGGKQQAAGDALVVAPEAAKAGAKVVDRMIDYYSGWPYKWVSWSDWENVVKTQVNTIKASSYYSTFSAYEPFNEPDGTWSSSAGSFNDGWTRTFNQIRGLDANKSIQGPSFSNNISGMQSFLQNAVATNTVPDIISWHELSGANLIQNDINTVVNLEKSLGITPRPIAIEEYAAPSEVGIPGSLVGYIAKFERGGVHDAELAFWNGYGALGDLLTSTGGSTNGAYWLYTWYAQMSGNMVTTTPYSQTSIDGAAALTSDGKQLSVIFGGGSSGSSAVQVNGISSTLASGGKVHVKLETTASTGRTGASSGATTTSESDYSVSSGSITVPVTTTSTSAYRLLITPVSGSTTSSAVEVVGGQSGRCMDVPSASTTNGTQVQLYDCSGSTQQLWTNTSSKQLQVYGNKCLDAYGKGTTNGTTVVIWDCNGGTNQQWNVNSDGTITGVQSGLCLDANGKGTANGTKLILWACNGGTNQQWSLKST